METVDNQTSNSLSQGFRKLIELQAAFINIAKRNSEEFFMDLPDSWYGPRPTYGCENGHISRGYLKTDGGAACLACQQPLVMLPSHVTERSLMAMLRVASQPLTKELTAVAAFVHSIAGGGPFQLDEIKSALVYESQGHKLTRLYDTNPAYKLLTNLLFRLRLARSQRFKAEQFDYPPTMCLQIKAAELEAWNSYQAAKAIYSEYSIFTHKTSSRLP